MARAVAVDTAAATATIIASRFTGMAASQDWSSHIRLITLGITRAGAPSPGIARSRSWLAWLTEKS